jgi:hypothetical protein
MIKIFHKKIEETDIQIYGKSILNDVTGAGYNIGDLLNLPSISGFWKANPHNSVEELERLYVVGHSYPQSIVHYYIEARPADEPVPNLYRVIGAVKKYIAHSPVLLPELIRVVNDETVLCVHIRCGDKETETSFLDLVVDLAKEYRFVYIFSGLHLDERFASNTVKIARFVHTMNYVLEKTSNVSVILAEPDVHLSMMSNAKHLLLHKGGFSAIGSLVCVEGTVYITEFMEKLTPSWTEIVLNKYITLECK